MKLKNRRQSTNVIIESPKESAKKIAIMEQGDKARGNPRTLSNEPIAYNKEKNTTDLTREALGSYMGSKLKTHLNRRSTVKDGKVGKFEKDAKFFKHTIKDK